MASLSTKIYAVVTVPALMSMAFGYTAIAKPDGPVRFLLALAIMFAFSALLLGLVTWEHHRICWLQRDRDIEARRITSLRQRISKAEDALRCRTLVRESWTLTEDDIRTLLRQEDN